MAAIPQPILDFYGCLQRNDYEAARACLHDEFSFVGWFDEFDSAEAYLDAVKRLRAVTAGIDVRRVFVDGQDVALFYDLTTVDGAVVPVAAWFALRGDRIARIRVMCDSRPFAALWGRT